MNKIILVAGATGNLGNKIVNALLGKGAEIRAIVRRETNHEKIAELEQKGVKIFVVAMNNKSEIAHACKGVHCVVSALSGLRDVIIDTQKNLLEAAIEAKVPRFIPSDYSIDFTNLVHGENRNLDLRREFHTYLEKAPIKATTIFNGAFMDMLTAEMPLILFKFKRILYWGNPNIKMDLTTTYNVAEFTANVALDDNTPRYLRITGDSVNAHNVRNIMSDITGLEFGLFRPGGIGLINTIINVAKFFGKNSKELYPAWQGMQYMRDMMEGRAERNVHANDRYKNIHWTSVKEFLVKENVRSQYM
jgi:NmrA-like family